MLLSAYALSTDSDLSNLPIKNAAPRGEMIDPSSESCPVPDIDSTVCSQAVVGASPAELSATTRTLFLICRMSTRPPFGLSTPEQRLRSVWCAGPTRTATALLEVFSLSQMEWVVLQVGR